MPRYQTSVTVPAGTQRQNAVADEIQVSERVIEEGFIFAPPGSAYEVNAVLLAGDRQILPEPESDPVAIPGVTDPAQIDTLLPGSPNTVELRVWAPTADFSHTIKARIDTVPRQDANPLQRLVGVFEGAGRSRSARQQQPEP